MWVDARMTKNYREQIAEMLLQLNNLSNQLKSLEHELVEKEENWRLIAEFAYDWEYWQDNDGNFVYVSPSCTNITGFKPEEFFADKNILKKIIHPDDWRRWEHHAHAKLADGEVEPIEFRIIKKNGELCWIHHVCRTVYSKEGDKRGIRGSNRDITEMKTIRTELKIMRGFLPICASCKMIRDEHGNWIQIEKYIREQTGIDFTHSICPNCAEKLYPEIYKKLGNRKNKSNA
jgi:PAS domain S-box-containing protein